jgi:hypothetical protein
LIGLYSNRGSNSQERKLFCGIHRTKLIRQQRRNRNQSQLVKGKSCLFDSDSFFLLGIKSVLPSWHRIVYAEESRWGLTFDSRLLVLSQISRKEPNPESTGAPFLGARSTTSQRRKRGATRLQSWGVQFWESGNRAEPNSKQRMARSAQTMRFLGVWLGDKVVPNKSAVLNIPLEKKKKKKEKKAKKHNAQSKNRFFRFFSLQNRLPYVLGAPANFEPNPSSHLGGDSEPSPDGQTDSI